MGRTIAINDRALVGVTGPQAGEFLQSLITLDVDRLGADEVRPAALLTPQGKIAYPFLISRIEDGFRLEIETPRADELRSRLNLYKLRAKVEITPLDGTVVLEVDGDAGLADRRFPDDSRIRRHYEAGSADADSDPRALDQLRIDHGVPEPDRDYAVGDAFAFDALLDQMGGMSVRKGCFVGQEVISRMHHRGTARRRIVQVRSEDELPPEGTALTAAGKPVGALGSTLGRQALALVRIDRVGAAMAAGTPVLADRAAVTFSIPERFDFTFPSGDGDAEE